MRHLVLGVAAMAWIQAQSMQELLLSQAKHITGTIVDTEGKPIPEARIDHVFTRARETDSQGRFDVDTRAPILVVRKAGFRSRLLRTLEPIEPRITLERHNKIFAACSTAKGYDGIAGWGASFQFVTPTGLKVSKQVQDVDYGARNYYLETGEGPKGIMHGSGPTWSSGVPSDRDVWASLKYEETTYDAAGVLIVDARGQSANGKRWRYLGKFGESASYGNVDEQTANLFDQFLDSACLKTPPGR